MNKDFGHTGIDPDWYDNGPGSENYKRRMREDEREYYRRRDEARRIEAERVAILDSIADAAKEEVQARDELLHLKFERDIPRAERIYGLARAEYEKFVRTLWT